MFSLNTLFWVLRWSYFTPSTSLTIKNFHRFSKTVIKGIPLQAYQSQFFEKQMEINKEKITKVPLSQPHRGFWKALVGRDSSLTNLSHTPHSAIANQTPLYTLALAMLLSHLLHLLFCHSSSSFFYLLSSPRIQHRHSSFFNNPLPTPLLSFFLWTKPCRNMLFYACFCY